MKKLGNQKHHESIFDLGNISDLLLLSLYLNGLNK